MKSSSMKWLILTLSVLPILTFGQYEEENVKVRLRFPVQGASGGVSSTVEWEEREFIVSGSVYFDKTFKSGKILKDGKLQAESLMRYNPFRDHFELQTSENSPQLMVKSGNVEAMLDGKIYQYVTYEDKEQQKQGYMNPLNDGPTYLYARTVKEVPIIDLPDHGYEDFKSPAFATKHYYYIKRNDRPAIKLYALSRKEVFAVLWDKYSELRQYARKNKLHMRNEDEVIQVLEYYDTLKSEDSNGKWDD